MLKGSHKIVREKDKIFLFSSKINFFVIRMELWKIGDSQIAPKFHVISQPNDWAKDTPKYSWTIFVSEFNSTTKKSTRLYTLKFKRNIQK